DVCSSDLNLWLRIADRVKIIVGEFKATDFDTLFEKTKALPWDEYIPLDGAFPVSGKSQKSKLYSVPDVQRIVNKAVATKLQAVYHKRGQLPETGELYPIRDDININNDLLFID